MSFPEAVLNAWHLAALSADIRVGTVRKVTVCGTDVALFRTADGVAALIDRCPHRNYPLSAGRVQGGTLECPYHGWRFAADGACAAVPGCVIPPGEGVGRLAAQPVRVAERHGGVFIALTAAAPAEPELPPDFGNPDLDHFWWQQGAWRGRAFDAVENVMDPFHTGHLHHGLIRRHDRRVPVSLTVTSHGRSIAITVHQPQPDLGLMSRFLERDRTSSTSRYYPPTMVEARWQGREALTLCVTAIFTPVGEDIFMPFARFSSPKGLAPGWLKQAAIRLFLHRVIAQDRQALARQHAVMQRFGHPKFVSGPGDILGNRLHRLWQGELLDEGQDAPRQFTL